MWVCDLVRQKQAMTCYGIGRIIVRVGEYTWYTQSWEGCDGHREFVGLEVFLSHRTSARNAWGQH
jgi:hypothetical protein